MVDELKELTERLKPVHYSKAKPGQLVITKLFREIEPAEYRVQLLFHQDNIIVLNGLEYKARLIASKYKVLAQSKQLEYIESGSAPYKGGVISWSELKSASEWSDYDRAKALVHYIEGARETTREAIMTIKRSMNGDT